MQDSRQHEEPAGGYAMGQHDEHGAVQPHLRKAEDAEHDESEVADRRIGDQLLHVGLHHGDQRAVDDADQGESHDPRSVVARLLGK